MRALEHTGCVETTPDGCPGTHDLDPASPARDSGVMPFCYSLDQRMQSRPWGGGCDLGAVESRQ